MKDDPNNWPDIKKIQYHLNNGDGFMVNDGSGMWNNNPPRYVTFQGRNYIGYASYKLTKSIIKLLLEHGTTERETKLLKHLESIEKEV